MSFRIFEQSESFQRGYDRGNYGAAYESQDFESWEVTQKPSKGLDPEDFRAGMLVGFFSSYEDCEIPEEYRDEVTAIRGENQED